MLSGMVDMLRQGERERHPKLVRKVFFLVFQKSGAGPKNGEQYEAPVIDEEWEEDELQLLPKDEAAEEFIFGDDIYLDANELDQNPTRRFNLYVLISGNSSLSRRFLEQAQLWRLFLWKPPCFDVSGGVFFSGFISLQLASCFLDKDGIVLLDNGAQVICEELDIFS
ncbi:hypothetical protein BC332_25951 [Capsicum chinense]|nr:hypothetical protein BC332_25951 [Capsicum chinense]